MELLRTVDDTGFATTTLDSCNWKESPGEIADVLFWESQDQYRLDHNNSRSAKSSVGWPLIGSFHLAVTKSHPQGCEKALGDRI
jgi:hypothetical protein